MEEQKADGGPKDRDVPAGGAAGTDGPAPAAAAHVPTSDVLRALVEAAPGERVSLDWLVVHLRERSFGVVMLLMALIGLVPAASTIFAVLISIPAVQMILGLPRPRLPGFVARRAIRTARLAGMVRRISPALRGLERLIRPRWRTPFQATKRVLGVTILLLGVSAASPVPFAHVLPLVTIMLIAFAYLEEDGVLLALALGTALISLAVTAAAVWGAVATGDWLDRIL